MIFYEKRFLKDWKVEIVGVFSVIVLIGNVLFRFLLFYLERVKICKRFGN